METKTCQVEGCKRTAYCRQTQTGLSVCFACYNAYRRNGTYKRTPRNKASVMPSGQICQVDQCCNLATRKHRATGLYTCDACAAAYTRNGKFDRILRAQVVKPILKDLLDYVVEYKRSHDGLSPGVRDVKEAFDLSSTSVAHNALMALVDSGDLAPIYRRRRTVGYRVRGYTWGKAHDA